MLTIQETIRQLHDSLSDYIEATYHISALSLIAQRKSLLDGLGNIHQIPYIESTPRYTEGAEFAAMKGPAAGSARRVPSSGRTRRRPSAAYS